MIDKLVAQLLKHQTAIGSFDATANRSARYYAAFNGQGTDRVVETTALAIWALTVRRKQLNNASLYQESISAAVGYLKTQVKGGTFGGNLATLFAIRALEAV